MSIWRLLDPSLHTTPIPNSYSSHWNHTAKPLLISMTNGLLEIHARLLQQYVVQRRVVPHVEPVPHFGPPLAVLGEDVVVPLGAG